MVRGGAAVLAVLALASSARAQSTAHATGTTAVTWTDNALNAPDDPVEGGPERRAAWMLDVAPGLAFVHQAPRTEYTASYSHPFRLYLDLERPVQQSDVLALGGSFALTERDQLSLSLLGSYARTSDALSLPSRRATTAPTPVGTVEMVNVAAEQTLAHALSEQWGLTQRASFSQAVPVFEVTPAPATYTVGAGLALAYARPRDSYGLSVGQSYLGTTTTQSAEAAAPTTAHWSSSATASWTHQLTPSLTSQLGAGSAVAFGAETGILVAPTASAALQHTQRTMSESLVASRAMEPDVLTGTMLLTDNLRVDAVVMLVERANLSGRTSHGVSWNRTVAGEVNSDGVTVWSSDVGLDWAAIPGALTLGLSFQHMTQLGQPDDADLPDLHRNQAMLWAGGRLPRQGIALRRQSAAGVGVNATQRPLGGTFESTSTPWREPSSRPAERAADR